MESAERHLGEAYSGVYGALIALEQMPGSLASDVVDRLATLSTEIEDLQSHLRHYGQVSEIEYVGSRHV